MASQHEEADFETRRPLLENRREDGDNAATPASQEQGTFARNLGTINAFAIVISIVIGSGVFTSPGSIDTNVPSPGYALIVWLIGGVLAWSGASTMTELGTAIPGEGGVQPYLRYIFGDVFGFLAGWTWIVAVMPATLAILSIVFVETIFSAIDVTDQAGSIEHKLLSVLILVIISAANSISTKASTRLNNLFVTTKFLSILGVVVAGLVVVFIQVANPNREDIGGRDWFKKSWFGFRETLNPDGSKTDWHDLSHWEIFGHFTAALYASLWAYSGWDKAIYIAAELSAPARQLPLAINVALPAIILCFLASNAAYYILLPWDLVSTTDSVAVTAITRLLGSTSGIIAAGLICLVVAGSLLGNSFVASRMTIAASNSGWLPSFLGIVGRFGWASPSDANFETRHETLDPQNAPKSDAPINSILLSAILSTVYILFGNFRALLTFNGLGEYSFFFLTVLGAIILRIREPELKRPYKPFVIAPVVFTIVSGFVVVRGAVFAPIPAMVLILVWIIGIAYYVVRQRSNAVSEVNLSD